MVREELGRAEDTRPVPEFAGAEPREVYFEALAAWRKVSRLAAEVGADSGHVAPVAPPLAELKPGHVFELLDAVATQLETIKERLGIAERASEAAIETNRQPSDVLVAVIKLNRDLSRSLERAFTPSDVFSTLALASAYASRIGGSAEPAKFERRHQPAHCYQKLESCLTRAVALIAKRGGKALTTRNAPPDVLPGDVFDLANIVLGEVAYLHALTPDAPPVHGFQPVVGGYRLPSHVYQLAATLEAQLGALG